MNQELKKKIALQIGSYLLLSGMSYFQGPMNLLQFTQSKFY